MNFPGDTGEGWPRVRVSDLWALTDICGEMVEIAAVVGILSADLQQEIVECSKEKQRFINVAGGEAIPVLRLSQFGPHIRCLKAIWDKYDTVNARTNAFSRKLEDNICKQKELTKWRRIIDELTVRAGIPINEKKLNDPEGFRKELEKAIGKGLETKALFESLKAEWNALKPSVTEDLIDCLRRASELLQRIQRHSQVVFEE